jgi:hypothetical protein
MKSLTLGLRQAQTDKHSIESATSIYCFLFTVMFLMDPVEGRTQHIPGNPGEINHHRFTIMMSNAHRPAMKGIENQDKFSIVPSWGFDYDFMLTRKWAIGLHNDLILQQCKIEKADHDTVIERSYPFSVCAMGTYKPLKHFSILGGIGEELEKNESFTLVKIGMEYAFELPKSFELSISFQYDNKLDAYDTWLLGVGFSKLLH